MKTLIISHAYVTSFNQRKIDTLSEYKDLDVHLFVPKFWKDQLRDIKLEKEHSDKFKIHSGNVLFNGKIAGHLYLNGLFKVLREVKPDIIHIEEEPWALVAFQIVLYKKILGLRSKIIVFTWENIFRKYRFISRLMEKFVLKNIDFAIAGNKDAKMILVSKGVKEDKIDVLPQIGVDVRDIGDSPIFSIEKIGTVPSGFLKIGFIGRLVEEKGIMVLLKSLLLLREGKWKLFIIGDGRLKEKVNVFIKENSLEDKVVLIGTVLHDEIKNYFKYLDVLVLPSITTNEWKEQFGHVIIEAFANNVAVIGSSSGSIPEVIGNAGLVFKEGNENDLAEKIILLMNDEELRKKLVKLGRERVLGNFTNEKIAEKTYKIYENSDTDF